MRTLTSSPSMAWIQGLQIRGHGQSLEISQMQDARMLPSIAGRARIFTCDWPSDMFQDSDSTPWTVDEFAMRILAGIQNIRQPLATDREVRDRPIVFIASCLGGIILMKALVIASDPRSDYASIRKATRGIIFLATPFRGTSFNDIATWAESILTAWASLQNKSVTQLLDSVKGSTFELETLVNTFTGLCLDENYPYRVYSFYEKRMTVLHRKCLPGFLLPFFGQAKLLVDGSSAKLDIAKPQALDRSHVMMNKFSGPDDPDYGVVASILQNLLQMIRNGRLVDQADTWIRNNHYTEERLKIDRLSGGPLPLDQCYINLAIVENHGQDALHLKEDGIKSSPFSLLTRQKVETPDTTNQVELATIFSQPKGRGGHKLQPRRIFIRGRAGVGKTTLCKKIIREFYRDSWIEWSRLFDRILWIPLRNLKLKERRSESGYDFVRLFRDEYFTLPNRRQDLAEELSRAAKTRTLFLLDGLDEVSQDLVGDNCMARLLMELLKQPNVIITSRPSAKPPPNIDLDIETVGFYPDQVDAYTKISFIDKKTGGVNSEKINQVQSFLREHRLIQGLVRIPIQLDALCYTWDDFGPASVPDTMTDIYKAIERKLWKKDVVRLEKMREGQATSARPAEVQRSVQDELAFLECLAFNGLYSDVISFTPAHRDDLVNMFPMSALSLDETLSRLSFLRTSDSSTKAEDREYHFIHLTFQEYFGARYFVRQWQKRDQLSLVFQPRIGTRTDTPTTPIQFLQANKYTPRYNILWRFVAGLLDAGKDNEILQFFKIVEEPPLDLLGPTHQRLVMHCLSEVSGDLSIREDLENRLSKWLVFECRFRQSALLASEVEFPEKALKAALDRGVDTTILIMKALEERAIHSPETLEAIATRLEHKDTRVRRGARKVLMLQSPLPVEVITVVIARLEDEDKDIRHDAVQVLRQQPNLSTETLTALVARLEDEDPDVQELAHKALSESPLPTEIITAVVARLEHQDRDVQSGAIKVLREQPTLAMEIVTMLVARLEHENTHIQRAAIEILKNIKMLPIEIITMLVARLKHENAYVQRAACEILQSYSTLPIETVTAVAAQLQHRHKGIRRTAIKVLGKQKVLPMEIITAIVARLKDKDGDIQRVAMRALAELAARSAEHSTGLHIWFEDKDIDIERRSTRFERRQLILPTETVKAIAARLEDQNRDIRLAAIGALAGQSTLPKETVTAVAARLDDENRDVRRAAIGLLEMHPTLPIETVTAVAARLEHHDHDVLWAAAEMLRRQPTMPMQTIMSIAALLEHQNIKVQQASIWALAGESTRNATTIMAIATRLEHKDSSVRRAAIEILRSEPTLPLEIIAAIAARLDDTDFYVQRVALKFLQRRSALPTETLMTIAARLEDQDPDVRWIACGILGERSELPTKTIMAIIAKSMHKDGLVRRVAILALRGQSTLPREIVMAVAARLDDEDSDMLWAIIIVLGMQATLPQEIITAIAARLDNEDRMVRWEAVQILGNQSSIPLDIIMAIAARLNDSIESVRWEAIKVLRSQSSIPQEIIPTIEARLDDKDSEIQLAASGILARQPTLALEIITAVAARLDNEDRNVRRAAIQVLKWRSILPLNIISAVAARLDNEASDIQLAAFEVLAEQSTLALEIITAIAARLDNNDREIRQAAVKVLGSQLTLPLKIITAVAARLDDEDDTVRQCAEHTLQLHKGFYYNLLCGPHACSFYRNALRQSFVEQQAWYMDGDRLNVIMGEQTTGNPIHGQKMDVRAIVSELQPPDMPAIC